jgi:2,3-bisphosphoglycerate-independent phosphoglycerate mutase
MNTYETIDLNDYVQTGEGGTALTYTHVTRPTMAKLFNPDNEAELAEKEFLTARYDWIVVNFANADMVGHTGVYTAIQTAVKTIDQCLNEVVETAKTMGYDVIITADHGNADHAVNADGTPNTTHSTNPVPFIYVTANKSATVHSGALADVAPSILHIMGLQQPKEMTGQCLINE